MSTRAALSTFTAIVVLAAVLRFPALDLRPMHADEAVQAAKFARLLERGRYEYDPREYHGPTLSYLTLITARVQGAARYADLDEITLRSVPAAAGVLLVAAHLLLVPVVGSAVVAPGRRTRGGRSSSPLTRMKVVPYSVSTVVASESTRQDSSILAQCAR